MNAVERGQVLVPSRATGLCGPTGKWRYATQEDALGSLQEIRETGVRRPGRVVRRAYACPWCEGWHLTHKAAGNRARKRKKTPRR